MEELSQDWFLIPFLINLVLLAYVNHNFKDHFSTILLSTVSYGAANKIYKEYKNVKTRPSLILNMIFYISVGVFSLQIIILFFPTLLKYHPAMVFGGAALLFFLITMMNKIVSVFSGFIFLKSDLSNEFKHNIDYFNQSLGLVLFPLSIFVSFSDIPKIAVYVGITAFFLLYLFRIIRLIQINFNNQINFFYMFLYLCTVEILPILYIGKTLKII